MGSILFYFFCTSLIVFSIVQAAKVQGTEHWIWLVLAIMQSMMLLLTVIRDVLVMCLDEITQKHQ